MATVESYEGSPDIKRLIAATLGEPTDRVPNLEVLIEDEHVEKLLGRKAGNTMAVGWNPAKGNMSGYICHVISRARVRRQVNRKTLHDLLNLCLR